jgi:hypothetical protein
MNKVSGAKKNSEKLKVKNCNTRQQKKGNKSVCGK